MQVACLKNTLEDQAHVPRHQYGCRMRPSVRPSVLPSLPLRLPTYVWYEHAFGHTSYVVRNSVIMTHILTLESKGERERERALCTRLHSWTPLAVYSASASSFGTHVLTRCTHTTDRCMARPPPSSPPPRSISRKQQLGYVRGSVRRVESVAYTTHFAWPTEPRERERVGSEQASSCSNVLRSWAFLSILTSKATYFCSPAHTLTLLYPGECLLLPGLVHVCSRLMLGNVRCLISDLQHTRQLRYVHNISAQIKRSRARTPLARRLRSDGTRQGGGATLPHRDGFAGGDRSRQHQSGDPTVSVGSTAASRARRSRHHRPRNGRLRVLLPGR